MMTPRTKKLTFNAITAWVAMITLLVTLLGGVTWVGAQNARFAQTIETLDTVDKRSRANQEKISVINESVTNLEENVEKVSDDTDKILELLIKHIENSGG